MKEKVMSAMQSFSKAMFMPVLILPSYCRPSDRGGKCFDKCKINGDSAIP